MKYWDLTKGRDGMKKKIVLAMIIIFAITAVFFPVSTTHIISGDGDILTLQKEKIGDCKLKIEIKEISSLILSYKKVFSFAVDGNCVEEFETVTHSKTDEIYFISQMYYDKGTDAMSLASLIYPKDLSYAILSLDAEYYFINNGANISYAQLPVR